MQKLYDEFGHHISFVMLTDDPEDEVRAFIEDGEYAFPVYYYENPIPGKFRGPGISITLMVADDGEILFKELGSAIWDDEKAFQYLKNAISQ